MIERNNILDILKDYDKDNITIGVLGSHSALDICRGAKDCGFNTLVVCQENREKTYSRYYRSEGARGIVDETLVLERFSDISNEQVIEKLKAKNTIFIPHRSFEVYVGFDRIENEFGIPLFGSRTLLRAEERDAERNQYYLMDKAGIPYPKTYKTPDDIDSLAIIKVAEAQRTYERAFFYASSPEEYYSRSKKLIDEGRITPEALESAVIEEFVVGSQVNFNYFYSPIEDRLELLGTDTRRQTNLDGLLRLPAKEQLEILKTLEVRTIEAGHIACTVKESLLEQIFELGEKFVDISKKEYAPGIIGPFALQAAFRPGPPKETAVVFDISLRVQGSPGTRFTPYSGYLYGEDMSVGKRISLEIENAIQKDLLEKLIT